MLDLDHEAKTRLRVTATAERRLLPRCATCHERHPLAFPLTAKVDPDHCPTCGAPAAEPGPVLTEQSDLTRPGVDLVQTWADSVVVVDRRVRLGAWLIRIGNALKDFAQRIAPDV